MGFSPESYTFMTMGRLQQINTNFLSKFRVLAQPLEIKKIDKSK
jgi:hypothetical protein